MTQYRIEYTRQGFAPEIYRGLEAAGHAREDFCVVRGMLLAGGTLGESAALVCVSPTGSRVTLDRVTVH